MMMIKIISKLFLLWGIYVLFWESVLALFLKSVRDYVVIIEVMMINIILCYHDTDHFHVSPLQTSYVTLETLIKPLTPVNFHHLTFYQKKKKSPSGSVS